MRNNAFLRLGIERIPRDRQAEPRSRLAVAVERGTGNAEFTHQVQILFGAFGVAALEERIEPGEIGRGFLEQSCFCLVAVQPISDAQAIECLGIVGVRGVSDPEVVQGRSHIPDGERFASA